jgi:hypothetical protein
MQTLIDFPRAKMEAAMLCDTFDSHTMEKMTHFFAGKGTSALPCFSDVTKMTINISPEATLARVVQARKQANLIITGILACREDHDAEILLFRQFIFHSYSGFRQAIASYYFYANADFFYSSRTRIEYVFCWCTLPLYLVVILATTISFFAPRIGERATEHWMLATVSAIALELTVLQPMKLFLNSVVLPYVIYNDVRHLFDMLRRHTRFILNRRIGLMRRSNDLVQHFNPACRAARIVPGLPIARLLLSIYDFEIVAVPIDAPDGKLNFSLWVLKESMVRLFAFPWMMIELIPAALRMREVIEQILLTIVLNLSILLSFLICFAPELNVSSGYNVVLIVAMVLFLVLILYELRGFAISLFRCTVNTVLISDDTRPKSAKVVDIEGTKPLNRHDITLNFDKYLSTGSDHFQRENQFRIRDILDGVCVDSLDSNAETNIINDLDGESTHLESYAAYILDRGVYMYSAHTSVPSSASFALNDTFPQAQMSAGTVFSTESDSKLKSANPDTTTSTMIALSGSTSSPKFRSVHRHLGLKSFEGRDNIEGIEGGDEDHIPSYQYSRSIRKISARHRRHLRGQRRALHTANGRSLDTYPSREPITPLDSLHNDELDKQIARHTIQDETSFPSKLDGGLSGISLDGYRNNILRSPWPDKPENSLKTIDSGQVNEIRFEDVNFGPKKNSFESEIQDMTPSSHSFPPFVLIGSGESKDESAFNYITRKFNGGPNIKSRCPPYEGLMNYNSEGLIMTTSQVVPSTLSSCTNGTIEVGKNQAVNKQRVSETIYSISHEDQYQKPKIKAQNHMIDGLNSLPDLGGHDDEHRGSKRSSKLIDEGLTQMPRATNIPHSHRNRKRNERSTNLLGIFDT